VLSRHLCHYFIMKNETPIFLPISAIIPALNEEARITGAIDSLASSGKFLEIVVADGGSSDATCRLAETAGARVVHCQNKGRGMQIAEAWDSCSGDVLVVLHADALFPERGTKAIQGCLKNMNIPGGAFSMGFKPATARTRIIAFLNHLRCRTSGISFGDQCQFVRRSVIESAGGFPAMKLMEDVELSLIMKGHGTPALLPQVVTVSPRRWETTSFSQGVTRVLFLFFTYLIGRKLGHSPGDGSWYHQRYYS